MKIAGLITAAGLSSRMGSFKPLLDLNGLPLIVNTVLSMRHGGLDPICVVIGHRGEELRPVLEPLGVLIAENPDPAHSDMLASLQLGLEKLQDSDGFFLLPADMPLIAPGVFAVVRAKAEKEGAPYVVPTVEGRSAHPPFIGKPLYDTILSFHGEGGLRAALSGVERVTIEAGDAGMNRDADRPEDYEAICLTAKARLGLSDERCRELWEACGTPEHVRRHCLAAAEIAEGMARELTAHGCCVDALLCRSGALLHDLKRTEHRHELAGGAYLRELGYERLASLVEKHMTSSGLPEGFSEETIVYLADKLVKEDRRVTPRERYAPALAKYEAESEIGIRVRQDLAAAERLCRDYEKLTGSSLYEGRS